jgi:hypothetical protein
MLGVKPPMDQRDKGKPVFCVVLCHWPVNPRLVGRHISEHAEGAAQQMSEALAAHDVILLVSTSLCQNWNFTGHTPKFGN